MYKLFNKYYAEYLMNRGLSERSLEVYIVDVLQFCLCPNVVRMLEGGDSYEALREYYVELKKTYSSSSLRRKMVSAKGFLHYLYSVGEIAEDGFRRFKFRVARSVVLPKFIPRKDLQSIFGFLSKGVADCSSHQEYKEILRKGSIVEFLYLTGVRVEELCNLTERHILFDEGVVLIDGKGGRQRFVPIDIENCKFISLYGDVFKSKIKASGHYFVNRWGNAMSTQSVRTLVLDVAQRAGIEGNITPHMFRHTLATNLIENGVDLRIVQEVIGHSSIKTTEIYTHVSIKHAKKELLKKHPYKINHGYDF